MGLSTGAVELALVSLHMPPTPLQELLPWLVAKKDHDADILKPFR